MRAEAVYTLVPLWERASESIPALWHLADGDADLQVRISALMGLEEMSGREQPDSAHLTTLLRAAHPAAVRVAAALVLVRVMGVDAPQDAIHLLWNALSDDELSMVGDSLRGVTPGRALHDLGTALNRFELPTTPEEIEWFLSDPSY